MDREPEQLQSMGVFGIYKESYKITISWKKIFSQITLSLTLPLAILYLSQIRISDLIFYKIDGNKPNLNNTEGTPLYNYIVDVFDRNSSQWITFGIIYAIYSLFLIIFSLLSTSAAVVYATASIYSSNEVTFKKVINVVPKVWKRLMVTFLWSFFVFVVYTGLAIGLGFLILLVAFGRDRDSTQKRANAFYIVIGILAFFYLIGLVYISVVCNLATVISVLEKVYGFKAMKKSRNLIKGKIWVASAIFVMLQICFAGLLAAFNVLIIDLDSVGIVGKVFLGIFCYLLLTILIHFYLVTQTVIYFVCKSFHHENIDRPGLAEHLEASYVRLNGVKDVQLEQVPV